MKTRSPAVYIGKPTPDAPTLPITGLNYGMTGEAEIANMADWEQLNFIPHGTNCAHLVTRADLFFPHNPEPSKSINRRYLTGV